MFLEDSVSNSLLPIRNFNSLFEALDLFSPSVYPRTHALFKEDEDGTAYMTFDLPGVKEEDLQVEVSGKLLHIRAERKTKTSSSSYSKSLSIPEKYDTATLKADLENGVLTLSMYPKTIEQKTSRKVLVNSK